MRDSLLSGIVIKTFKKSRKPQIFCCLERALVPPVAGAQVRCLNRTATEGGVSKTLRLKFPLGSAVPSVVTVIRDLHRVTQPITYRENLSAQLGVVNEVFI